LQEGIKIIARTDKYERIRIGEVGRTTPDFVLFKHRTLTMKEVVAHPGDWQIKSSPSFVGSGNDKEKSPDTGEEIPF